MLKKILTVIATILITQIPFFPVLENIVPVVDHETFTHYLIACGCISLIIIFLGIILKTKTSTRKFPSLQPAAWILFSLGIIVMIPLHMGPPKMDAALLTFSSLEKFRYTILIIAVVVFAIGIWLALKPFWATLSTSSKVILIPLLITLPVSLWDYYDSFSFSTHLTQWIDSGKNEVDFFSTYNFHETWRVVGRILLYVVAAWLSIILYKKNVIKKWVTITLSIFSLMGIGFCLAFLALGPAFYFPFMVPAIALAPTYWLGVGLLSKT